MLIVKKVRSIDAVQFQSMLDAKIISEERIGTVMLSLMGKGKASTSMPIRQPMMEMKGFTKTAQASIAAENPANVPSMDFDLLNG